MKNESNLFVDCTSGSDYGFACPKSKIKNFSRSGEHTRIVCYASPARTDGPPAVVNLNKPSLLSVSDQQRFRQIGQTGDPAQLTINHSRITDNSEALPRLFSDFCTLFSLQIAGRPLLLSVGGCGRACGGWVASYASPARTAMQRRRNALNKCLMSPSSLALFEDSYLVANMNRSGHERGSANGKNRLALVNHHADTL